MNTNFNMQGFFGCFVRVWQTKNFLIWNRGMTSIKSIKKIEYFSLMKFRFQSKSFACLFNSFNIVESPKLKFNSRYLCSYTLKHALKLRRLIKQAKWRFICESISQETIKVLSFRHGEKKIIAKNPPRKRRNYETTLNFHFILAFLMALIQFHCVESLEPWLLFNQIETQLKLTYRFVWQEVWFKASKKKETKVKTLNYVGKKIDFLEFVHFVTAVASVQRIFVVGRIIFRLMGHCTVAMKINRIKMRK